MIVQRTTQVWTAAANLFRRCLHLGDNNFLFISVERCSRSMKLGAVFRLKSGKVELSCRRYFFSPCCCYLDCINQVLATDYGYFANNSGNN